MLVVLISKLHKQAIAFAITCQHLYNDIRQFYSMDILYIRQLGDQKLMLSKE